MLFSSLQIDDRKISKLSGAVKKRANSILLLPHENFNLNRETNLKKIGILHPDICLISKLKFKKRVFIMKVDSFDEQTSVRDLPSSSGKS